MSAFYNEIDPYAAQWLRNLISAGHIAPGVVDERSIEDINPEELHGYTQCHFFAGIGVWSHALRLAGWPDDKPVWTGSCPCQPFSSAGKGNGTADERHLWPFWFHLIEQCRPPVVFGEQVEAAIKHGWLDLVQSDMEGIGYAFAAAGIPAAGVGAPHIRQRLWFVADALFAGRPERGTVAGDRPATGSGGACGVAHTQSAGSPHRGAGQVFSEPSCRSGAHGRVANSGDGSEQPSQPRPAFGGFAPEAGGDVPRYGAGPLHGFWRDADWLFCRDGKWRPVEPGTFPLAHGAPARVGRLRAYGNAIVAQCAETFIRAHQDIAVVS